MLSSIAAISVGASTGAILRWLIGLSLNSMFPAIPLGTLAANLLGGYLIGVSVSVFALYPALGAKFSLLVITGFLGSLTTFSSFSFEVASLMQQGNLWGAGVLISLHVCGSLAMTFLGMASFSAIRHML